LPSGSRSAGRVSTGCWRVRAAIHSRKPAWVIHRARPELTYWVDSQTERLLSTSAYYSIVVSLIGSPGCAVVGWSLAMVAGQPGATMSISISSNRFTLDNLSLLFSAFGHTVCWMRGDRSRPGELIVDHPKARSAKDGSAWHWSKKHGRWTTRDDGSIVDGYRGWVDIGDKTSLSYVRVRACYVCAPARAM
jgi:hypothetical protein